MISSVRTPFPVLLSASRPPLFFPTCPATLPAKPSNLSAGDKMEFSGPQTAYLG